MNISLVLGDITEQRVDAIVNAANPSLLGGGGVDGAIHRKGGPSILEECQQLRRRPTYLWGLPTGQAVATGAGDLRARHVIHTVGPIYSEKVDRSEYLISCYEKCLSLADVLGAKTIAFPAISAGVYGWPLNDAADIAVFTVLSTPTKVQGVKFVLFTEDVFKAFEAARDGGAKGS